MFYDLNVPWTPNSSELKHRIAFLAELGYNAIALSHEVPSMGGNDPAISPLPFDTPPGIRKVLSRCTVPLTNVPPNSRIAELRRRFDIVALRPTDEKTLAQACQTLDADMISLDLGVRYSFPFKFRMIGSAIDRGMKIEICYGHGISSSESDARRNLIQNACSLVRSARGRGIVISSEASSALGCRAPHDIVNLAVIWGLKQEIAMEAVTESARVVVAAAQLRKRSYKGAIDVVRGGESNGADAGINIPKQKRKAEDITQDEPKQLSKAQTKKRQKKKASMAGNTSGKPEPKGEVASD